MLPSSHPTPRLSVLTLLLVAACSSPPPDDAAFARLQARGETAMGVDQYTSSHRFIPLPDGGRIELQRDSTDSAGTARIREHMRTIAAAFAAGDFQVPGFVHDQEVPGTGAMAARRAVITYAVESLPRGAAVRLTSTDAVAVRAIHEFLRFQRHDHRAGDSSAH